MENKRGQSKKNRGGKDKRKKRKGEKKEMRREREEEERIIDVKKVTEKWKIWDKEEKVENLVEEAKKLVPKCFHQWIYVFEKKASKKMPMKKLWNYTIETKEEFVPRKGKVYSLLREERQEVHEFIQEQLRKGYIRLLKLLQTALVFFVGKKDSKK